MSPVAESIVVLSYQSKENVENIQGVTDAVKNAVENLKSDAQQMLEFVETDVTDSYHKFDELAGFYNEDATSVNELVSDFSATSEELLASISSILEKVLTVRSITVILLISRRSLLLSAFILVPLPAANIIAVLLIF